MNERERIIEKFREEAKKKGYSEEEIEKFLEDKFNKINERRSKKNIFFIWIIFVIIITAVYSLYSFNQKYLLINEIKIRENLKVLKYQILTKEYDSWIINISYEFYDELGKCYLKYQTKNPIAWKECIVQSWIKTTESYNLSVEQKKDIISIIVALDEDFCRKKYNDEYFYIKCKTYVYRIIKEYIENEPLR